MLEILNKFENISVIDHRKDEGYGAEIRLRCEKIYEAVLIAKYISERVSCFKKFDIKIDEKYKVQAQ